MSSPSRIPSTRQAMPIRISTPRPPWSTETSVKEACTSCGHCIAACPQGILTEGRAKTPIIDFGRGECTFCGRCAEICPESVFAETDQAPWHLTAQITEGCLLSQGIGCQLCTDCCEAEALRIDLSHRPMGKIMVDDADCTGCGACIATCPVEAIYMVARVDADPHV